MPRIQPYRDTANEYRWRRLAERRPHGSDRIIPSREFGQQINNALARLGGTDA